MNNPIFENETIISVVKIVIILSKTHIKYCIIIYFYNFR